VAAAWRPGCDVVSGPSSRPAAAPLVEGCQRSDAERVELLERLLAGRTRELDDAARASEKGRCFLTRVIESLSSGLWVFDESGRTELVNAAAIDLTNMPRERARESTFADYFPELALPELVQRGARVRREARLRVADGSWLPVLLNASVVSSGPGQSTQIIVNCDDLRDRRVLEHRLRTAQKLEAVGQLAAGVAHEVNTPIQFIGDSVRFLQDCLGDLAGGWSRHQALFARLRERGALSAEDEVEIAAIESDADATFVFTEGPAASERTLRGVVRVAEIVRALRAFAHPDSDAMSPGDVNAAIRDATLVGKSEYKRVASLVLELEELPPIACNQNELTQVFLNLLLNATHAIEEMGPGRMGTIKISSSAGKDFVRVTVSDDGAGIPEAVQPRIFEPFFTTKPLGKGTGQGLALAYRIVEDHHHGSLTFATAVHEGTTFCVRIPIRDPGAP